MTFADLQCADDELALTPAEALAACLGGAPEGGAAAARADVLLALLRAEREPNLALGVLVAALVGLTCGSADAPGGQSAEAVCGGQGTELKDAAPDSNPYPSNGCSGEYAPLGWAAHCGHGTVVGGAPPTPDQDPGVNPNHDPNGSCSLPTDVGSGLGANPGLDVTAVAAGAPLTQRLRLAALLVHRLTDALEASAEPSGCRRQGGAADPYAGASGAKGDPPAAASSHLALGEGRHTESASECAPTGSASSAEGAAAWRSKALDEAAVTLSHNPLLVAEPAAQQVSAVLVFF